MQTTEPVFLNEMISFCVRKILWKFWLFERIKSILFSSVQTSPHVLSFPHKICISDNRLFLRKKTKLFLATPIVGKPVCFVFFIITFLFMLYSALYWDDTFLLLLCKENMIQQKLSTVKFCYFLFIYFIYDVSNLFLQNNL